MIIVAAAVDRAAIGSEQDIAFFHAGEIGGIFFANRLDVNAAGVVGQLEPLAERGIFGAGDRDPEAGESGVISIGRFLEETGDDVGGGDIAELVLGVVAEEHAGEFAIAQDRE